MVRGPVVRWIAVVTAACLGAVACRQLVGIGDTPPGAPALVDAGEAGEAGGVCGLPYDGACGSCVQTSCCLQATACAGDPSCAPFASCVAACGGDPECRSTCTVSAPLPSSSGKLEALSACLVQSCETVCGVTCGGFQYLSSPDSAAQCQTCIANSSELCSFGTACGALADCHAWAECSVACQGRGDCREACAAQHDAGAAAFAGVLRGLLANCDNACAVGGDWQCLGHVAEPYPSATTSCEMSLQVVDVAGDRSPLSGVEVSLCSEGVCAPGTTTGADGIAKVSVPLVSDVPGPKGYLSLHSPVDAGEPAIAPTLFFWGFPLTQPAVTFAFPPPDAGTPVVYVGFAALSPLELTGLAGEVEVTLDPQRGQLGVSIADCLGAIATGVQVDSPEADAESGRYYTRGTIGSITLSKLATTTDASGTAVFTNMPAGSVDIVASLPGQSTPVARASVLVQPGVVTLVYLSPTQ